LSETAKYLFVFGLNVARWARFTSLPYFFSHSETTSFIGMTTFS